MTINTNLAKCKIADKIQNGQYLENGASDAKMSAILTTKHNDIIIYRYRNLHLYYGP